MRVQSAIVNADLEVGLLPQIPENEIVELQLQISEIPNLSDEQSELQCHNVDQKNHETVSLSKEIFADLIKTPSPKIDDYRSLVFAHQERYFKNNRGTISSFEEKSLGLWKSFGSILQTSADGKTSLFPDPKPTYFNPHAKNEGAVPLDVLRAPQFHYLLKEFPKEGSSFKDPRIDFVQFSQNTLRLLHKKIDNLFAHKQFISLLTKFDIRE